jgi:hypothetical protein
MSETLEGDGLTVTIIEAPTLGDHSYVVDDGRSALVVDPQRDIDRGGTRGPAPVDLSPVQHADRDEVRERIEREEWVMDLRDRPRVRPQPRAGTVSFDGDGSMAVHLGWLVPGGPRSA